MFVKNNLKICRKKLGICQQELAVKASCSPCLIVAVEKYGHFPSYRSREKLSGAIGVSEMVIWPNIPHEAEILPEVVTNGLNELEIESFLYSRVKEIEND